jgi:hypothetical protein
MRREATGIVSAAESSILIAFKVACNSSEMVNNQEYQSFANQLRWESDCLIVTLKSLDSLTTLSNQR